MNTDRLNQLEMRLQTLERRNRRLSFLLMLVAGLLIFTGCQKSSSTTYVDERGGQLMVSADGLTFKDPDGNIRGELTSANLLLGQDKLRPIRLQTDSVNAGLTVMQGESPAISLWTDGTESQFVFEDVSGSRRASLTTNDKSTDFYIVEAEDKSSVSLMCQDGVSRVIQSPKSD